MNRFLPALKSEFRKIFATKTWWVLLIILFGYTFLMALVFSFFLSSEALSQEAGIALPTESKVHTIYSVGNSLTYVIPIIFGTLLFTSEVRHSTLTPTFLATPTRSKVFFAKLSVAIFFGILYGIFQVISAVAAGSTVLSILGDELLLTEPDTLSLFVRIIGATIFWVLLGLGIGSMITNQVTAIVVLLVFTQFLDPILRMLAGLWDWSARVLQFLPSSASDAFVGSGIMSMMDLGSSNPFAGSGDEVVNYSLDWWQAGLVLVVTATILMVIGYSTHWRKDVS